MPDLVTGVLVLTDDDRFDIVMVSGRGRIYGKLFVNKGDGQAVADLLVGKASPSASTSPPAPSPSTK